MNAINNTAAAEEMTATINEIAQKADAGRGLNWWTWEELELLIASEARRLGVKYPNRLVERLTPQLY